MDSSGVDMHVLSLFMPGVQLFARDTAIALARTANDRLAETIRRHPTRFAGLASVAPQDPRAAVIEIERAVTTLKLHGAIINSHTDDRYLDDQQYWPILEAAEALGVPLYLHPRAPSAGMAGPFRDYRMDGAVWGYGIEVSTHVVRLMFSGVLDRFPRLRIIIGHMGEALPFWMWRLDFMGAPGARGAARRNELKPSEYLRCNVWITTSGVEDPLALRFCLDKLAIDRITPGSTILCSRWDRPWRSFNRPRCRTRSDTESFTSTLRMCSVWPPDRPHASLRMIATRGLAFRCRVRSRNSDRIHHVPTTW